MVYMLLIVLINHRCILSASMRAEVRRTADDRIESRRTGAGTGGEGVEGLYLELHFTHIKTKRIPCTCPHLPPPRLSQKSEFALYIYERGIS